MAHEDLYVCPHMSIGPMTKGALHVCEGVPGMFLSQEGVSGCTRVCVSLSVFGNAHGKFQHQSVPSALSVCPLAMQGSVTRTV